MSALKRGRWSTPELARLRQMFPRTSVERVAQTLSRSVESVRAQAARLFGYEAVPKHGEFGAAEDQVVRRGHGVVETKDLAMVLQRPLEDVEQRIVSLREAVRTGEWAADEIAMLKELYSSRCDVVLEACLSRRQEDIAEKASELCLRKDKGAAVRIDPSTPTRMPRWSSSEVAYLREAYPTAQNLQIARKLGRSVTSVANKAHQLGLKKAAELRRQIGAENALGRRHR